MFFYLILCYKRFCGGFLLCVFFFVRGLIFFDIEYGRKEVVLHDKLANTD